MLRREKERCGEMRGGGEWRGVGMCAGVSVGVCVCSLGTEITRITGEYVLLVIIYSTNLSLIDSRFQYEKLVCMLSLRLISV